MSTSLPSSTPDVRWNWPRGGRRHTGSWSNSRWFEDTVGQQVEAVAAGLPADLVAALRDRGRERDLGATVDELLAELE